MSDGKDDWGFYGRKRELEELTRWLSVPRFAPMAVIGGRGVGKTELINEAAKSLKGKVPYFYLELPEIEAGDGEPERLSKMTDVCVELADQARAQGLAEALPMPEIPRMYHELMRFFGKSFKNLLKRGSIIVLDEFQNARKLSLVDDVKSAIDRILIDRDPQVTGKLVVAGSHQQQILNMLYNPRQQLYQRINLEQHLFPLRAPDLLEMAADQGWLSRPNRFLTAYSVFGGIPRLWRRLADDQAFGALPEPGDGSDESWRRSFVMHQIRRIRRNKSESFFNSAFVDLSEEPRAILDRLKEHPGGVKWQLIVDLFKDSREVNLAKAQRGFHILNVHLGIVNTTVPPGEATHGREDKICITEPAAIFELRVLPHWVSGKGAILKDPTKIALGALSSAEGFALERLTKEQLEWFPMLDRVDQSVEYLLSKKSRLEIDVVGETKEGRADGKRWLVMCSCKRNPDYHNLVKTAKEFDEYLALRKKHGDEWDKNFVRRLLVSPDWPEDTPRNDEFARVGIQSFAKKMKLESKPWPYATCPAPAPEPLPRPNNAPEDDNELTNGM